MKAVLFLLPVLQLFLCINVTAQNSRPGSSREPSWVTKNNLDYNKTALDKDSEDGYIFITDESQISLAENSIFHRSSKKIISQAGVQNASEVSVTFDPSYEQLTFHTIKIIRKEEILNKLQLANIKTVHQEKELKQFIYNGSVDAILILDDVRKDDIIECSYTIKGFNPIFKNKFSRIVSMSYAVPVYDIYFKIIVPSGRHINIKNINESLQPVTSIVNNQQVYEWHKTNISALHLQDYTPSWYNPYAEIQISEYNNWKEVNDWAMELFPLNKELSTALKTRITNIKNTYGSDSEKLKASLRFVQDDIRYMGIEIGENSHNPADPSKVFAQRFGDCKEKSYLLCCMLNAMNIEANPVLINTTVKKNLTGQLPSPISFDHVTVRVKLDENYYWFDPTISNQRGAIKDIFYPEYQAGLVVSHNTTNVTSIALKNTSAVDVKEHFVINDFEGTGTLVVTTAYKGYYADNIRNDFNNSSVAELLKSYQKFYSTSYEDIKADSLNFIDDDNLGTFTTFEYYSFKNCWSKDKDNRKRFNFFLFMIDNLIKRPKEKDRSMPFSILFPSKYHEKIIIDMPEDWKVEEAETHLKNAGFSFDYKFYCFANHVYVEGDYESFKDFISVDEVADYFADLREYDNNANFNLTYGDTINQTKPKKSFDSNFLAVIAVGAVIIGAVMWGRKHS